MESEILTMVVAAITAGITAFVTFVIQERKLRRDFENDIGRIRTEYTAEKVVKKFRRS